MTSPQTGNREFRDEVVTISSLTVVAPTIEDYRFVNCRVVGPAVLGIVDGVVFNHCQFEGEFSAFFWEVDPSRRPLVMGAVGLKNVEFHSCSFQAVGIAGSPEFGVEFEKSFG
ncbi:hypothetical protein GCM10027062_40940 [Nocardioides hungaricus]